jgi:hypothetical protein
MNDILKNMNKDDRFLIDNIIGNHFIIDYGFITAVSSDKKFVDVKHIIKPVDNEGQEMPETITKKVELLFSTSSYFSLKFEVAVGDGVLLLGTKDYIGDISGKTFPEIAEYILHYKQENLKALPFGFNDNPKTVFEILSTALKITSQVNLELVANNQTLKTTNTGIEMSNTSGSNKIAIDNGLISIKNTVSDQRTQMEYIWSAISSLLTILISWTSTNCVVGAPVTPNPATTALLTADKVTAEVKKAALATFLK